MGKFYIIFLVSILPFMAGSVVAQRYFITNQYAYDLFLVNPSAVALKKDCFTLSGYYQKQWFGTDLAPTTQIIAFQKGFQSDFGSGTYLYNDRNGNYKELGAQQTFGYKVQLAHTRRRESYLLFGMSLMLNQRMLDIADFGSADSSDPLLAGGKTTGYGYNANAGIMVTVNSFQVGFSATNLLPYTNSLYSTDFEPKIHMDLNFHVGFVYKIPRVDLYLEPLVLYRRNNYLDSRTDLNVKLTLPTSDHNLAMWGLLAYRRVTDAQWGKSLGMAVTAGVLYQRFKIGLEYQFGLTSAHTNYGDSYELILGYRFCRDRRKDALLCPEDFKRNRKKIRK